MQLDDYRDDLPVSRGQHRRLAELALDLLGEPPPPDRLAATILLARLEETRARRDDQAAEDRAAARAAHPVAAIGQRG